MNNYDGPLYAPYDNVLMGKLTKRQWQTVEAAVRKEQSKNVNNQPYYHELRDILDVLYQLAHDGNDLPDAWSFEWSLPYSYSHSSYYSLSHLSIHGVLRITN